ncbi:type II secretion system protein N [Sphingomonas oligophenolica]|uniref:Type II secretory protein PulC n=1 Tax=Sphingomonas oligophenolica TaxID=301154 RepID=A0A502CFA2_9SPHN|nr:type II secretion system protein N [Sphingomonas oligophenolica]TPG12395.1 type II secretory protein PulC [Sphingomonas oligophenolica]
MQLKFDARARRILRRLPVVNVYSLTELVLIAALAAQASRLVWTIVTPIAPLGDWRPPALIVPGNPAEILAGFDPFFRLDADRPPGAASTLALTLFGIRVESGALPGSAIVAGPDGVQTSVAVGEEIQPGVVLKAVAFDHVTIARGGLDEDLFMPTTSGTPASPEAMAPPGGAATVPTSPADRGAIQIGQLKSQIGFIARIDAGRISGLVVRPQGSGAAFRAAGFQEGDVVTSIGGRPVTGPGDLDRIETDFAQGGNIPVTVERGSQTLPLAITIAPPK